MPKMQNAMARMIIMKRTVGLILLPNEEPRGGLELEIRRRQ